VVTAYFVDSSALVKRYVLETGTPWIRRPTRHNPSTVMHIAHITAVEVTCAVARRRKGKTITTARASLLLRRFRQHLAGRYVVIEVTPALLAKLHRQKPETIRITNRGGRKERKADREIGRVKRQVAMSPFGCSF
jgi:hypothetical protein